MNIQFGKAQKEDLTTIIDMLVDDPLGNQRESENSDLKAYESAFHHIESDPNNELIVAREIESTNSPNDSEERPKVVAVLQLTYMPSLTYQGSWRAQIEGVRVHKDCRGLGLGESIFKWAIERAQQKGCKILQLTSDKKRPDAIRFYEKLGFKASHEGFKLHF